MHSEVEGARRRSRVAAQTRPDLRHLRDTLGLSPEAAAKVLGEPESLVLSQERTSEPDGGYLDATVATYMRAARELGHEGRIPTSVTARGASRLLHLRTGLGLSAVDAARVLGVSNAELDSLEGTNPGPDHQSFESAWCTYADWSVRR